MDLVAKFEQWCCSRNLGKPFFDETNRQLTNDNVGFTGIDTLQSMRKEVTRMVKDGLCESSFERPQLLRFLKSFLLVMASKRTKCAMNYEQYTKVVVLGYGVMIVGWPKSIDFTSPTNISSVERQGRSDKGRIRGENVRTTSKRQAGKKSKSKSKAMVEDEDEDEDDDDEEDQVEDDGQSEEEEEEEEEEEPTRKKKSAPSWKSGKAAASKRASLPKKSDSGKKPATRRPVRKDDHGAEDESEEEAAAAKKKKASTTNKSSTSGSKVDQWWKEALRKGEVEEVVREVGGKAEEQGG